MNINILDFIIIASILIGYFISIVLFLSPLYKSKANNYLSVSLFLINSVLLLQWLNPSGGTLEFLKNIMWEFLFPVTLYMYFLAHLNHPFLKANWLKWLYLPFLITLPIDILLDILFLFNTYSLPFSQENIWIQLFYTTEDTLIFFFSIFLMIWSRRLVIKTIDISTEKKKWLLWLNAVILTLHAIWFFYMLENLFSETQYVEKILWALIALLSWWILYYGIFKLQIITQKDEIHNYLSTKKVKVVIPIRQKITVPILTAEKVMAQLCELMKINEQYKNPLLSRLDLANQLNISESYLSQIVNQETNKSIIQFVNSYRVESAKKQLKAPELNKYSVEAIGLESGFKSKSAFYRVFKNLTGISPGEYRKQATS